MKRLLKRVVLPRPGPRRLPLGIARGVVMEIDFDRNTRLFSGLYEVELSRFFRAMLRLGGPVFDVGAQLGYHSLVFAKLARAPVLAFDPDAGCVAIAEHNIGLNPDLAGLISVVPSPVGEGPDEVRLDDYAFSPDGFCPAFVKVDVDGGELSVLRSGRQLLAERPPALVVETHSRALEQACGRLLVDHGYRPRIVNQRRLLPDARTIEFNRWLVAPAPRSALSSAP